MEHKIDLSSKGDNEKNVSAYIALKDGTKEQEEAIMALVFNINKKLTKISETLLDILWVLVVIGVLVLATSIYLDVC